MQSRMLFDSYKIAFEIVEKVRSGEYTLVQARRARSKVWLFFANIIKPDGEQIPDFAYCRSCQKAFKHHKSTSNLMKHKCFVQFMKSQENTTTEILTEDNSTEGIPSEEYLTEDDSKLTKLLSKWIIKDNLPGDLLQSEDLKAVFQEILLLGSKIGNDAEEDAKSLPCLSDVTKNITKVYMQCLEEVYTELSSVKDNGFALAYDIRNDNLLRQNYIALTAHYMNNDIATFCFLGLRAFDNEKNENSQQILQQIEQILRDFGCRLSNRHILVADPAYALRENVTNAQNLPCISELLSSAAIESMRKVPEMVELINNCSNLVNFLMENDKENVFDGFLSNTSYNSWLDTYNMLSSVQSNWNKIEKFVLNRHEKERISMIRVHHLKAVINTLQSFEEALEILGDDTQPTLHLVVVALHELKKSCAAVDNEFQDFDCIEQLKENLRYYLDKIALENVTILHKVALFLYPPTKKLLQFNDDEKKSIEDECMRLMAKHKNNVTATIKSEPESSTFAEQSKRKKFLADFLETEADSDPNEVFVQEILFYKNVRVAHKADFNAFSWWQIQKDNFPHLCKLGCTLLATPATCSTAKRICSDGSSLLRSKSAQPAKEAEMKRKMIFIKSNTTREQMDSYFSSAETA